MLYRCKIVIQIDCAGLERLKSTTEKVRGGFIRVGKKYWEKKIFRHYIHAGPASYSESRASLTPFRQGACFAILASGRISAERWFWFENNIFSLFDVWNWEFDENNLPNMKSETIFGSSVFEIPYLAPLLRSAKLRSEIWKCRLSEFSHISTFS